jgi:hypothetical protein
VEATISFGRRTRLRVSSRKTVPVLRSKTGADADGVLPIVSFWTAAMSRRHRNPPQKNIDIARSWPSSA